MFGVLHIVRTLCAKEQKKFKVKIRPNEKHCEKKIFVDVVYCQKIQSALTEYLGFFLSKKRTAVFL